MLKSGLIVRWPYWSFYFVEKSDIFIDLPGYYQLNNFFVMFNKNRKNWILLLHISVWKEYWLFQRCDREGRVEKWRKRKQWKWALRDRWNLWHFYWCWVTLSRKTIHFPKKKYFRMGCKRQAFWECCWKLSFRRTFWPYREFLLFFEARVYSLFCAYLRIPPILSIILKLPWVLSL